MWQGVYEIMGHDMHFCRFWSPGKLQIPPKNRSKFSMFGPKFFFSKNDLLMIADRLVAFLGCFGHYLDLWSMF